jgi:hypothetical protein
MKCIFLFISCASGIPTRRILSTDRGCLTSYKFINCELLTVSRFWHVLVLFLKFLFSEEYFFKIKIQFMQNKEKESVQKDKADKRDQATQNDSSKHQSSMSGKNHEEGKNAKESQSQHGTQKQNGQSGNQKSQDRNENWKNQDDSEIDTPGKHEEDDKNNTSKKIPQMKSHGK